MIFHALYAEYAGSLYTVLHMQTNQSMDVGPLTPGGFADVHQHETLCPYVGDCVITRVIDQVRRIFTTVLYPAK